MEVVGPRRHMWAEKKCEHADKNRHWGAASDWRPIISTWLNHPRIGLVFEPSCETDLDKMDLFLATLCSNSSIMQKTHVYDSF